MLQLQWNIILLFTLVCKKQLVHAERCIQNGTLAAGGHSDGSALNQLGGTTGKFNLDKNDNIYIADQLNRVVLWSKNALIGKVIANDPWITYLDVFVLQSTGEIYILNYNIVLLWNTNTNNGTWVAGLNGTQYADNIVPRQLFVDNNHNIYIMGTLVQTQTLSLVIIKLAPGTSTSTIVAGGNGFGSAQNQLSDGGEFYVDNEENIYIADTFNHRIQKWSKGSSTGVTVAGGNGYAVSGYDLTKLFLPGSVVVDGMGNLYIADGLARVIKWDVKANTGTLLIGGNVLLYSVDPGRIRLASDGSLYVYSFYDYIKQEANQRIERFNCSSICDICIQSIQFYTSKYISNYGPAYGGLLSFATSALWNNFIASQTATLSDKLIINAVSQNEGKNFDAVQSYDSEIVTVGAMQKTIDLTEAGEFPQQVWEFMQQNSGLYTTLFQNCGWTVKKQGNTAPVMSFDYMTGLNLKNYIRQKFTPATWGKQKQTSDALGPIVCAMSNNVFQTKQIQDFIDRLHNVTLVNKPTGYNYVIGNYFISNLGRATALDQHVNRPGNVNTDVGIALNVFYQQNPSVSKNPTLWGNNHTLYETSIIAYYGIHRRMTDAVKRYNALKIALS